MADVPVYKKRVYAPLVMSSSVENTDWIKLSDPQTTVRDRNLLREYWAMQPELANDPAIQAEIEAAKAARTPKTGWGTTYYDPNQPRYPAGHPLAGQWRPTGHVPSEADKPVWEGLKHEEPGKLTKPETGAVGEELAIRVMSELFGEHFGNTNVKRTNMPVDIASDSCLFEVKAGLASNESGAQQWRATDGGVGIEEALLMKEMTPAERSAHNEWRQKEIMRRKAEFLAEYERNYGRKFHSGMVGVILSPDGTRGDVFLIPGYHERIGWKGKDTPLLQAGYVGTYRTSWTGREAWYAAHPKKGTYDKEKYERTKLKKKGL